MLTKEIVINLKGPSTKNLKPPELEARYTIEMDGDPELEGTMWAYYEKHFTKLATKKLQEQLNAMKTPLRKLWQPHTGPGKRCSMFPVKAM